MRRNMIYLKVKTDAYLSADGVGGVLRVDDSGVTELGGPGDHVSLEGGDGLVTGDGSFEVLELLAGLGLDVLADLNDAIEENADLGEVLLGAVTGSHGGGADADTAGGEGGLVAGNAVAVEGDVGSLADLLDLAAGELVGADVPEEQVIVGTVGHQLVAELHHGGAESLGVLDDALGVIDELGGLDLLGLDGETGDLVVVGAALKAGEHSHVDAILDRFAIDGGALVVEDHTGTGTGHRLVGGGGDDVSMLERTTMKLGGDETRNMSHVDEQVGTNLIADSAELAPVDLTRVGGGAGDDHLGAVKKSLLTERVKIEQSGDLVNVVRERLEVDGSGRDLLFGGVVSMGKMSSGGKIKTHDAVVGLQERGVHLEVGGGAGIWLDVDAPFLLVEMEGLEHAALAQHLNLVDHIVAAVVASAGLALRVLVGKARAEAFQHGT